jgi:hypothetical protein
MTRATQEILDKINALPDAERSALVVELARLVASEPHSLPDDADLVAVADEVLLDLDRREQEP